MATTMSTPITAFVLLLWMMFFLPLVAIQPIPALPERSYVELGDINLGAFLAITEYAQQGLCGQRIRFPLLQQYVEALVYAFDEVNNDADILPNVRLGYAILDDCVKENTAVAQALRFLPRKPNPECGDTCDEDEDRNNEHYDVVGVIGPQRSENSIAVSYVLGPVKIPQVSFFSTSDELSNKELHSNFLRVIPPDKYQVKAIMSFVLSQGWTYISVLYSSGSYGEFAYNNMKTMAAKEGVCIATQRKTTLRMTRNEYVEILTDLMRYPRAKVIIAFLGGDEMVGLFEAVYTLNISRMFIWVGSDGWSERLTMLSSDFKSVLYGSFTSIIDAPPVPKFNVHFTTIKPSNTKNPWFVEFWERMFNCSFANRTCDETRNITESPNFHPLSMISKVMDTVYTYAHALQNLLADVCPGVSGRQARDCVKGEQLLMYLKNVSFQGYSGHIKFDGHGNLMGSYMISQVLPGSPYTRIPIRLMNLTTENITVVKLNPISWQFVSNPKSDFPPGAVLPLRHLRVVDENTPVSVCSRECAVGEYVIPKNQPCCWDCRLCRDNEIVVNNRTACRECPMFSWPDPQTNFTQCKAIEPIFPVYKEGVVVFEITASFLGIVTALCVIVAYFHYREASVIRASSRELSFLQLLAILLGYITMMLYVTPPTHVTCSIAYWLFCFSLNLLYAPLLVKAIRIYRIFNAAAKGTRGLKLVSPLSQVVISCVIVMGQVVISTFVTGLQNPTARLTQPVRSERYVELSCDMTLSGLGSFLAYNLTLVLLCSVFAFKTRMVPDNFNESRFISMCVTTTLVIWLAFIPTFVTSSRQYLKTLLLTLALLLNHSVALFFLFLSKLYAVMIYKENAAAITVTSVDSSAARFRLSTHPSSNNFAPNSSANNVNSIVST